MNAKSRDLETLFNAGACGGFSDGQLLERFIAIRDETSFEILVHRHAPMVWGVCRRVLRRHHDAEDAFQATFLVLARKAGTVNQRETVANWLYAVACQTARKARAMSSKREGRERHVTEMPEPAMASRDPWTDLVPVLDEELSRLPDHYRAPIILCDLEGKTRKEAARQLGWPEGTISSRLARARSVLARRLSRRGIALTAGALSALIAEKALSAFPPSSLLSSTVRTAALIAAGEAVVAGGVSVKVAALTGGVLKSMLISKLKVAIVVVMAAGVLGTGLRASGLAAQPQAADSQGGAGTTSSSGPGDKQPDRHPLEPVPDKPATRLYDLLVQSAAAERSDAAPLSDETFIRRIYLDVLGRPATPAEIQKFNDEQAEHRFKLVDRVLKEVGASHRNKSEDVSPSKTTIVPSDDDLAQLHRRADRRYENWKIQNCATCHGTQKPVVATNLKVPLPDRQRNEIVRDLLVRQATRDIDQVLKRLREDMPDRQTELDALDEIEKAVRVMKEKVKQRTD